MFKSTLFSFFVLALMALAYPALANTVFGRTSETVPVNKTVNLSLNPEVAWNLGGINKPDIISAFVESNNLKITALKPGIATAYACKVGAVSMSDCFYLTVTVIPENVLGVNTSESNYNPHAIGTFVLVNKTVFYVHATGLIPISTWEIYLSVAPKNNVLIPANEYDLQLPLLPLMETNDSRTK